VFLYNAEHNMVSEIISFINQCDSIIYDNVKTSRILCNVTWFFELKTGHVESQICIYFAGIGA